MSKKESGWGREKKEERIRKIKEDQRIVKDDFNDPFKFKPQRAPPLAAGPPSVTGALSVPSRVVATPPPFGVPSSLSLGGAQLASVPISSPPVQQSAPLSPEEFASSPSSNLAAPPVSMATNNGNVSLPGSSSNNNGGAMNGNGQSTPMNTRLESAVCIHAALVELHEHHGLKKSKPYGPKGAAILKSPLDGTYSLLLYAPITKKHEFELEISAKFTLTILPSLFATFSDPISKRYWSVQFKSQEDLDMFCRFLALVKDYRSQVEAKATPSLPRRIISQDLTIGAAEHRAAATADLVKLKYAVFLTSDTHPMGIGKRIGSFEPKRFALGAAASLLPPGIEEHVIGMKKKSVRFLCVPPSFNDEANVWGPHVAADATLLVEITVLSVRSPEEARARGNRIRAAKVRGPTDSMPPDIHPHLTGGAGLVGDDNDSDNDSAAPSSSSSSSAAPSVTTPSPAPAPATAAVASVQQPGSVATPTVTPSVTIAPSSVATAAPAVAPQVSVPVGVTSVPVVAASVMTPTLATNAAPAGMNPAMYPAYPAGMMPTMMHPGMMPPMMVYGHDMMMAAGRAAPPLSLRDRMRMLASAGGTGGVAPSHVTSSSGGAANITNTSSPEGYPSVSSLLTELHLTEYIQFFAEEGISFKDLVSLSDSDLKELIPQMGPRRRILARAHELAGQHASSSSSSVSSSVSGSGISSHGTRAGRTGSSAANGAHIAAVAPIVSAPVATAITPSHASSSSSSVSSSHGGGGNGRYNDDDLRREYERGQSDTLVACKERIEQIKNTAKTKFSELESELALSRKKNNDEVEQARAIIGKLRAEFKAAQLRLEAQTIELRQSIDERDRMRERSRQYVAQVQEREAKREPTSKIVRACMERVFTQISAAINPKDITDGAQMLEVVKRQIQAVTLSVMGALEKEAAAQAAASAAT